MAIPTIPQTNTISPATLAPSAPPRAALRLALTLAGTVVATASLWSSGRAPATAWTTIGTGTADERVVQCLRLAGLAVGAWLVAVTTIAIGLRWCGARLLSRLVERLLPAAMRRLVHLSFGVTIGITTVGSFIAGPAMAAVSSPTTSLAVTGDITNGQRWPVLPLPGAVPGAVTGAVPTTAGTTGTTTSAPRAAATHRSVAKGGQVSVPRSTAVTSAAQGPAPVVVFGPAVPIVSAPTISAPTISGPKISTPTISAETGQATTWTVQRGDHLWSIAERVVHHAHPDPGEHDVARYWLRLIEANRRHLVDPDNPDLIRVGQHLDLPPTEA